MRTFVFVAMLLAAVSVHAEDLKPLPERGRSFSGKVWTEYSIETLYALFPDHRETVRYFRFFFVDHDRPSVMTLKDDDHYIVWVSTGLVDALASEHEYAYLLGHEIGHVVLRHKFRNSGWTRLALGSSNPEFWAKLTAEELEAELFAGRSVPHGFCAGAGLVDRELANAFPNPHPREEWQVRLRIGILERMCYFVRQKEEE